MAEIRFKSSAKKKTIDILADLISINSVNPKLPGGGEGERKIAKYIKSFLLDLGAEVKEQEVFKGRYNVVGRIKGKDSTKSLVYEAHMDTASVENMAIEPFKPVVRKRKMYGRGSCDTKGSLAAMLCALKMALGEGVTFPTDVIFVASVDEEFKAEGIYCLVNSGFKAKAAVVGEPTELKVAIAHKGCVRWRIVTKGKSVQSSRPEKGISAIYKMVDIINTIRSSLEPRYRARKHPLVGSPTINIGRIEGGVQVNTVPDLCSVEVDRRTLPGEDEREVLGEFEDLIKELKKKDKKLKVRMEKPFLIDPSLDTPRNEEIVLRADEACKHVLGHSQIIGVTYGSDASKLARVGIPSIVLGPGNIVQAHSAVEYVNIDQVMSAVEIYARIALNF